MALILNTVYLDVPNWMAYGQNQFSASTIDDPLVMGDITNILFANNTEFSVNVTQIDLEKILDGKEAVVYDQLGWQGLLDLWVMPVPLRTVSECWTFSHTFMEGEMAIVSGPPMGHTNNVFALMNLVHPIVIVISIISIVVISRISLYSEKFYKKLSEVSLRNKDTSYNSQLWLFTVPMVFGVIPSRLKGSTSQLLFGVWLILPLIVTRLLASFMVYQITVQGQPNRIEEIEDILKYPKIKPLIVDAFQAEYEDNEIERRVLEQSRVHGGIIDHMSALNSLSMVGQGDAVLIYEELLVSSFTKMSAGDFDERTFYLGKERFNKFQTAFLIRRALGHKLIDNLNVKILRVNEAGLRQLAISFIRNDIQSLLGQNYIEIKSMDLSQLSPIIFLTFLGISLSLATFIIELGIGYFYLKPKYRKRRRRSEKILSQRMEFYFN